MYKKPIIAFEGIEATGKSHHIKKISLFLKKKRIQCLTIREPGGHVNSEKIRRLILDNKSNFNHFTDLLLYLAARNENIENIIKKNAGKKVILIDRFVDSTVAYQHYGMNININIINYLNNFLLKGINVNFTFLNLVNSKNMKSRLTKRKNLNRYDRFKLSFYTKVQKGFIKIAKSAKNKYLMIDSNKDINHNEKIILSKIINLINIK